MYSYIHDYNIVIGSRRHPQSILVKKQNNIRRFIGKSCSILTNLITSFNISDTQCGFKAFDGDIARVLADKQTINGFAVDVEMLYIAHINAYSIKEIHVIWENDEDSKVKVIDSSLRFFKDLLYIKSKTNQYKEK